MAYLSSQKSMSLKFLFVNNSKWYFLNKGGKQKPGPLLIAVQAVLCTTSEDAIYIEHNVSGAS